jgi:RNA polymerase sigma factor (TIGR02999 family)
VNEVYLRLVEQQDVDWQGRAHFFAASAQVMRRILVDYARQRASSKRGGGARRVTLEEGVATVSAERGAELIALDDAMQALDRINPRGCKVVELRYFGGLDNKAAAEVLSISETTVERDWRLARAWLYRELQAR